MKYLTIVLAIFLGLSVFAPSASAGMKIGGYQMGHLGIGQGQIYSKSAFPVSVSTDINNQTEDLSDLRSGKSSYRNYFRIVEVGNGGIHKAVRKGNLKRVSIVMVRIHKIHLPLGYVPLYYKEAKTVVYGNCEEDL